MIAISTAYKKALVGVEIDEKVATRELDSNCKHSENILPAIDSALEEVGKSILDNDVFGVVVGPGSFTGIRIASALVKGFMAGGGQKAVTVTTFDLMAYSYIKNFSPKQNFVTVINGLSGFYFVCKYNNLGEKLQQEKMITKAEFDLLEDQTLGLEEEGVAAAMVDPTAKELLELCNSKASRNEFVSVHQIIPIYLRKSQAEVGLEEKLKKK